MCCTSRINPGTDLALFNALMTEIAAKGWLDKEFIQQHRRAASTRCSAANKTTIDEAAQITGLSPDQIRKAAAWIAEPKDGKRRRTMFCLRKGTDLGQRQLPHQRRPGEHCARDRQHWPARRRLRPHGRTPGRLRAPLRCACRPAGRLRRSAPHIGGKGGVHHIWACDHFKTTLNALEFKKRLQAPHGPGEVRHGNRPVW